MHVVLIPAIKTVPRLLHSSRERCRYAGGRSPAVKRIVLTSTGGIALAGLLLAFPAVAEALFWGPCWP